jgi:hypothetical protein
MRWNHVFIAITYIYCQQILTFLGLISSFQHYFHLNVIHRTFLHHSSLCSHASVHFLKFLTLLWLSPRFPGPVQSSPVQSSPVQSSPVLVLQIQSAICKTRLSPRFPCPVQSSPVRSSPVQSSQSFTTGPQFDSFDGEILTRKRYVTGMMLTKFKFRLYIEQNLCV